MKLYNLVMSYSESLQTWMSDLMEIPFFVELGNIRNTLVDYQNEYLREHRHVYEAHQAQLQEIRDSWSKEEQTKSKEEQTKSKEEQTKEKL
jgi:hypothetical protein